MTRPPDPPAPRRVPRGAVFWLLSSQLIMFTGIAALFPIAPLYVAHRGGNAALLATLTDLSEPQRRTERFAQQQASETAGLLLGPLLGGGIALWRDSGAFGVSGLLVLIGLIPMLRVPETMALRTEAVAAVPRFRWRCRALLVPATGLFAVSTLYAMYEIVWPQYICAVGLPSRAAVAPQPTVREREIV